MIIKKLSLKNFKKFADNQFEFSQGINVIHGRNEQGKTTVADALLLSIYGDPTSHSKKFEKEYSSWSSGGDIVINTEFNMVGKDFTMEKNFTSHTFKLQEMQSGKVFENYRQVEASFLKKFGIASEALYRSTAFFSNQDLTDIGETKSLSEAIKQAIVGMGGVKISDAIRQLDKNLTELNKGLYAAAKTPGIIKHIQMQVEEKNAQLAKVQDQVNRLKNAMEEKKSSGSKLGEIEGKIKALEAEMKAYDQYKNAEKEIKQIEEKAKSLERDISEVKRIQSDLDQRNKELASYENLVKLDADKVEERLAAVKLERDKAENERDHLGEVEVESPGFGLSEFAVMIGGGVIGALLGFLAKPVYGIAAAVAGVLAAVVVYGVKWSGYSVRLRQAKSKSSKRQKELAQRIAELKATEEAMLKKIGVSSVEEFAAGKARLHSTKLAIKELQEALTGYLSGRKLEEMEKEQLELFTKKKEIENTSMTDEVKAAKMDEKEYYKKRSDLDMLRLDLRDLSAAKGASDARVKDAEVSVDDVSKLEEEIAGLEEQLGYYEKKARILQLAKEGIEKARDSMVESSKEFIEAGLEKGLTQVTAGKYSQVKVEPNLDLEVFSKDKDDWTNPEDELSSGTIDQIYLAFRLALLEVVSEAEVPIVMDDPFLTFDEERLETTRVLLNEWAKKHQILLFTTRNEYKDWGTLIEI